MAVFEKKSGAPAGTIRFTIGGTTLILDDGDNPTIETSNAGVITYLDSNPLVQRSGAQEVYVPPTYFKPLDMVQGEYAVGDVLTLTDRGWEGKPNRGSGPGHPTIMSLFGSTGETKLNFTVPMPPLEAEGGFSYPASYRDPIWDLDYWKSAILHAKQIELCNGVKLVHDPRDVHDGLQTSEQMISRVLEIMDYATSLGLMIYLVIGANQNLPPSNVPVSLTDELAQARQFLTAVRDSPTDYKIVGIDCNNEFQYVHGNGLPDAEDEEWMDSYFALVGEVLPGVPATFSILVSGWAAALANASTDWFPTMQRLAEENDVPFFIDIHPYALPGLPAPFSPAQYKAATDLRPTVPLFFGEAGIFSTIDNVEWENFFMSISDAVAGNPNIPGWVLYPQGVVWPEGRPDLGSRVDDLLRVSRIVAKTDGGNYGTLSHDLVPDNAALTTSLATVGTVKRLKDGDSDISAGKVPAWRLTGEVLGLEGGDQIEVEFVNDSNVKYGTGSRLSGVTVYADGESMAGVEDSSSHDREVSVAGAGPTLVTEGGRTGFNFTGGRLIVPQIPLPADDIFFVDFWFKISAGNTGQPFLAGQWKTGASSTGDAVFYVFFDVPSSTMGGYFGNTFQSANTPAFTPDSNWHHFLFGRRSNGLLVASMDGFMFAPNGHSGAPPAQDGVTPFSVGDIYNGGAPFLGKLDHLRVYAGPAPATDFTPDAAPASDANTLLLLTMDSIEGGEAISSARFATPVLPMPDSLSHGHARIRNATAARGTVARLAIEELAR